MFNVIRQPNPKEEEEGCELTIQKQGLRYWAKDKLSGTKLSGNSHQSICWLKLVAMGG
jgi:hypothetical protein